MCGRLNVTDNEGVRLLMEMIGMPSWPAIQARYNIAPTAHLDVLAPRPQQLSQPASPLTGASAAEAASDSSRQTAATRKSSATAGDNSIGSVVTGHWGIIPGWARKGTYTRPLINARSETVWEKASFKKLIQSSRVVVPVTGFYEWKREKSGKTAYYFTATQTPVLLLAGICDNLERGYADADTEAEVENDAGTNQPGDVAKATAAQLLPQIAILTTAANETMQDVHDRMPVILQPDDVEQWLYGDVTKLPRDTAPTPTDATPGFRDMLDQLMLPAANDILSRQIVSNFVNNARNEGPECIEPAA